MIRRTFIKSLFVGAVSIPSLNNLLADESDCFEICDFDSLSENWYRFERPIKFIVVGCDDPQRFIVNIKPSKDYVHIVITNNAGQYTLFVNGEEAKKIQ